VIVFLANNLFRIGWEGGIGGYISYDFLTYYAIGKVYWSDAANLYDPETLLKEEQQAFLPTSLEGGWNIYTYPPYIAFASGILNLLPYETAYYLWTVINIICILTSAYLLSHYLILEDFRKKGLSGFQLAVVIFSIFPVVFGLILGQNHGLTLLLIIGILLFSLRGKWIYSGVLAGLLLYKPHFVIGFLIIWLFWKKWKALAAFAVVAGIWFTSVLLTAGFDPYIDYLNVLPDLMTIPLGAGSYLEMTPYALLLNIFSAEALDLLVPLNQIIIILAGLGIAWVAHRKRGGQDSEQKKVYVLALLFPFLASPHLLFHDMVLLIPLFILWADLSNYRHVLYIAIITYFSLLLLPFLTYYTKISMLALLPLIILIMFLRDYLPVVTKPK
jgi:hypothetical protein